MKVFGSEEGSYLRLIDLYHSTLGSRVMKNKKKTWWFETVTSSLVSWLATIFTGKSSNSISFRSTGGRNTDRSVPVFG